MNRGPDRSEDPMRNKQKLMRRIWLRRAAVAVAIAVVGEVLDNCDDDVLVSAQGGDITGECIKSQT